MEAYVQYYYDKRIEQLQDRIVKLEGIRESEDFKPAYIKPECLIDRVVRLEEMHKPEIKTEQDFIFKLKKLQDQGDTELDHIQADILIAEFLVCLGYKEIAEEYEKIDKWYA